MKKLFVLERFWVYNDKRSCRCGGMADTLDSGSSEGNFMQVQVLSPAPKLKSCMRILNSYMTFLLKTTNNGYE